MSRALALKAIYKGDVAGLKDLLNSGLDVNVQDRDGRTLLMEAVLASPGSEIVNLLVQRGADVNVQDSKERWTALAFAARDQKPELVRILLGAGATVDSRDAFGNTPLWRSVYSNKGDVTCIELLVKAGANPDAINLSDNTPRKLAEKLQDKAVLHVFSKR